MFLLNETFYKQTDQRNHSIIFKEQPQLRIYSTLQDFLQQKLDGNLS